MAALIDLRTGNQISLDVPGRTAVDTPFTQRPSPLRVIHGGRSLAARRLRRTFLVRRAVVVILGALLVVGLAQVVRVAFAPTPASATAGSAASFGEVHLVQPGDTLWAMASTIDPDADPRDVVDRIIELNRSGTEQGAVTASGQLQVGRELRLPVAG